jgi:hypothetical protein
MSSFVKRVAVAGADGHVRLHRGHYDPSQPSGEHWEAALALPNSPHREWVRDVAWSPASGMGGNVLASCSDDGLVALWTQGVPGDDATWRAEVLPPFSAPVWRVSWSVTGHLLAVSCADNSVSLWRQSASASAAAAAAAAAGGGVCTWEQVSAVPDPTLPQHSPAAAAQQQYAQQQQQQQPQQQQQQQQQYQQHHQQQQPQQQPHYQQQRGY